jgi:sodium/proline symporter
VAGSSISSDLYVRIFAREHRASHLWANRLAILTIGVLAVLLVIDQEVRVYKFVLTYGWAILGATFGPQLVLLLFWRRASYAGCLAGMVTGFAVALLWPGLYDAGSTGVEVYNLPLAFVAALLVNVVVSLLRPMPGGPGQEEAEVG